MAPLQPRSPLRLSMSNGAVHYSCRPRRASAGASVSSHGPARHESVGDPADCSRGRPATMNGQLAAAALTLLGIPALVRWRTRFSLAGPVVEQTDAVHARCCAYVVRQLRRRGWETRVEVEIGEGQVPRLDRRPRLPSRPSAPSSSSRSRRRSTTLGRILRTSWLVYAVEPVGAAGARLAAAADRSDTAVPRDGRDGRATDRPTRAHRRSIAGRRSDLAAVAR